MNWEQNTGKWTQVKGELKQTWGKLTDDDILNIAGKRDVLIGKLQERYGYMKDAAEKEVDQWVTRVGGTFDKTDKRIPKDTPSQSQFR